MALELSQIRQKIDAIDNNVHDLLMERAALVSSVAAVKRKEGLQIVQPAREARMIRRLLSRHNGPLPQATIVRIWRELVGSVSLLQTGLNVAVAANQGQSEYWDMAKNYFGSAVPMKKINGNSNTISSVSEDESSFGVMPWPELESASPWWVYLFEQQSAPISIICALPYGAEKKEDFENQPKGLIISKIEYMPSDDDVTFIGLKLNDDVSRTKLNDNFTKAGFRTLNSYSAYASNDTIHFYLLEVKGYYAKDAPEVQAVQEKFESLCLSCDVLGGYPCVPELKRAPVG